MEAFTREITGRNDLASSAWIEHATPSLGKWGAKNVHSPPSQIQLTHKPPDISRELHSIFVKF